MLRHVLDVVLNILTLVQNHPLQTTYYTVYDTRLCHCKKSQVAKVRKVKSTPTSFVHG